MEVELQYNPYWVQTRLVIDGKNVAQADWFSRFRNYINGIPLQTWLDPIPDDSWDGLPAELEKLGQGGVGTVSIHFTGRQVDFEDLQAAAKRQSKNEGARFEFPEPQITLKDEDMDELIRVSIEKIRSPEFAALLDRSYSRAGGQLREKYDNLEEEYARVRDTEFRIVFAGLYSSGKSTLINALVRKQLLPMADGTCTAKVFRIEHKRGVKVAEMCCTAGKEGEKQEVVPRRTFDREEELLKEFNRIFPKREPGKPAGNPEGVEEVHLWADLSHLYPEGFEDKFKLVLADTPGTNSGIGNGVDEAVSHHEIATQAIASVDKEMVVLVTSAGNEQAQSLMELLNEIDQALEGECGAYDQRFLFVLNKCDAVSYADQESLKDKLSVYREYISHSRPALKAPRVFPIAAQAALAVRSGITSKGQITTQTAQNLFKGYASLQENCTQPFGPENYCLEQYAAASEDIRAELSKELEQAGADGNTPQVVLIHSGLPSLERSIQAYIARYAYPLKVQALLGTFYSIFTEAEEWNSALARQFEKVDQQLEKAGNEKKGKEKEKEVAGGRKKHLKNANDILDGCKGEIDAIDFDWNQIKMLKNTVDQEVFQHLWNELNKNPQFKTQQEADRWGEELAGKFQDGEVRINEELDKFGQKISGRLNDIESRLNQALDVLRESGALDLEGFDFTKAVAFNQVFGNAVYQVMKNTRKVDNPIKRERYKPWQLGKIFKQLFAPQEIDEAVFSINMQDLKNGLHDLSAQFNDNCDSIFKGWKELLEGRKRKAAQRTEDLQNALQDTGRRLEEMEAQIRELADNEKLRKQERDQLDKDRKYLDSIQDTLKDCVPLL